MPYKNPADRRRAAHAWREAHPDYAKNYFVRRKSENPELVRERARRVVRKQTPRGRLIRLVGKARERARAAGIPFSITADDLRMPTTCPVLGIPIDLSPGAKWANRPSLDRVDSSRGYVSGNVEVISFKANTRKSSLSIGELRRLLTYMEAAELVA